MHDQPLHPLTMRKTRHRRRQVWQTPRRKSANRAPPVPRDRLEVRNRRRRGLTIQRLDLLPSAQPRSPKGELKAAEYVRLADAFGRAAASRGACFLPPRGRSDCPGPSSCGPSWTETAHSSLPPGQIFLGKVNFRKLCAAKRIDARPRNLLKSFKFGESSIQFRAHLSKMVICAGVLAADRTGINFLLDERHQTNASRQRS